MFNFNITFCISGVLYLQAQLLVPFLIASIFWILSTLLKICVPDPGSTICYSSFKTDFCLSHRMRNCFKKVNGNFGVYFRKGEVTPLSFSSMVFKRIPMQFSLIISVHPTQPEVLHWLAFFGIIFLLQTGSYPEDFVGFFVCLFSQIWPEVSWQKPKSQGVLNSYVMLLLFTATKNADISCCAAGW